jgi:ubiquinone/menaquinone biosynthesis C-methylase UbiE
MLFLSPFEKKQWAELGARILADPALAPQAFGSEIRSNLQPVFVYYAGALLAARGQEQRALAWFKEGARNEDPALLSNAYLLSFLERHGGKMVRPAVVFADPRPFIHFAGTPEMKSSRANFIRQLGHALPGFSRPFRVMDIGTGDGALLGMLLRHLQAIGKVGAVGDIMLNDASPAMLALAEKTLKELYPRATVRSLTDRIENVSNRLEGHYDLILSSLAYHHLPLEKKRVHLRVLAPHCDHFAIFELDANNDTPELGSPELALSVYQSYGQIIGFVFAHDAPVDVALASVDCFLMTEAVSLLTQPRGARNDYHMLRGQWQALFAEELGPDFSCGCDSISYADEYLNLFTMHYGRSVTGV